MARKLYFAIPGLGFGLALALGFWTTHQANRLWYDNQAIAPMTQMNLWVWARRMELVKSQTTSKVDWLLLSKSVSEAEQRFGISPEVLFSLIFVESSFNPQAVSHKGAIGLAQVMPDTAEHHWGEFLETLDADDQLRTVDPVSGVSSVRGGILFGAFYLALLKKLSKGHLELALASYNMGFGRAKKLFEENDGLVPAKDYVEKIMSLSTKLEQKT